MSDHITVVGTVVNDPERRQTSAGVPIINFRLASNVRRRDEATGTWVDGHTNWYAVSAYRGLAEHALESVRKGHRVIVSGSFKLREWEANGRQGVAAEIDAVSLGHDLLWGTTVYRRSAESSPAGPNAGASTAGEAESAVHADLSGSWAPVPGEEGTPY
ncbi:MAG: single-stranded DNA-binding protein [Candidatus Microbacterium phytovorans]|uniref:Single-stranded DNA-binding protein n=1 Tax=Candidatus Microbacterium phytovorans TaxID=3121374 RepID=A0AAJ6B688_9MICO|nr:single-stranded DNA-binding protein [Microbacterium sp.]WEK14496.1 MAG: single-stranded DNA-binding protein [Microbacterium sp.]